MVSSNAILGDLATPCSALFNAFRLPGLVHATSSTTTTVLINLLPPVPCLHRSSPLDPKVDEAAEEVPDEEALLELPDPTVLDLPLLPAVLNNKEELERGMPVPYPTRGPLLCPWSTTKWLSKSKRRVRR
jgi:hypothetical protein